MTNRLSPTPIDASRRPRGASLLLAGAGACALWAASSADAATVTVGSPMAMPANGTSVCLAGCTWANTALGETGANFTSPISGTIVRWRLAGGSTGGPFELRVIRSAGGGLYTGFGTSGPAQPVGSGDQTFTTNLPIQAGDLIGINEPSGSGVPRFTPPTSTESVWNPALPDGTTATAPNNSFPGFESLFNADVQPSPGISSISPSAGPTKGGTTVMITGHDFTGTSAVNFGSVAAKSFTVNSDTQITAVSPAESGGTVDVTVTTPAGQTPAAAADRFTFGCVVPKLKGKQLKRAKKALKKVDCRLGKVKPKGQKTGKVKKQKPKPGKELAAGAKVNVKLG